MYRSILVPLDGSKFGEHALPLALKIARRAHADLQLVHVHVPPTPMPEELVLPSDLQVNAALRDKARVYLDGLVRRLRDVSTVSVKTVLLEGPIGDVLVNQAVAAKADLIVMTTHGRGSLARAWLGGVADELVRRTPTPLLLVRPHEARLDLSHEPPLERVLIPLDGSLLAEQVVEPAVALGSLARAEFTLVRVVPPMVLGNYEPDASSPNAYSEPLLEQLRATNERDQAEATRYLEGLAQRLRLRPLNVRTRILGHEQPAVAILEEAKANRTDLVAIATHGRSGLARLFLGSVADKVLRATTVPVLVCRPPRP